MMFLTVVLWSMTLLVLVFLALAIDSWYRDQAARRTLLHPDPTTGRYPLPREEAARIAASLIAEATARQAVPHTYHVEVSQPGAAALPLPSVPPLALPELTTPTLPGITDLTTVLRSGWTPGADRVLLGLAAGGEPITARFGDLWHVALAGPTGNGKSNIMRLLLAQLLAMKGRVVLADPKFTPYDVEADEDWRPIAERLFLKPARTPKEIADLLSWSVQEMHNRIEQRARMERIAAPLFVALDELPQIAADNPQAISQIAELVRVGRGVGVFVVTAAQDMLMSTLGGRGRVGGAVRDNFRTAYYLGGDTQTGSVLLDVSRRDAALLDQQIQQQGVGAAVATWRGAAGPTLIRVPYASNTAIYDLLPGQYTPIGRPTAGLSTGDAWAMDGPIPMTADAPAYAVDRPQIGQPSIWPTPAPAQAESPITLVDLPSPTDIRILELFYSGSDTAAIVAEVYEVTSKAGARYQQHLQQVQAVIRQHTAPRKAA